MQIKQQLRTAVVWVDLMLYLQFHIGLTQVLFTTINGFAVECLKGRWWR